MISNLPKSQLLAALTLTMVASSAAAQSILSQHGEVVHAVGDPLPAAAPGVTPAPGATIFATSHFDSPTIDQNGTVVYRARFTGGGATSVDDRAFFMGRSNADLQMVVRAGDQAPGLAPGILLRSSTSSNGLAGPRISPFAEFLLFASTLHDPITPANTPTTADSALFYGPVGGIIPLAVEGQPVPFLGTGALYGNQAFNINQLGLNANGHVLFTTSMTGGAPAVTTADDAIMVAGAPGALQIVQREGEVLTGGEIAIVAGGNLAGINQYNEAGEVLYDLRFSTTLPSTATTPNDRALAIWNPISGRQIIAREGDPAPGMPANVVFGTNTNGWTADVGPACFTKSGNTVMNSLLWDAIGGTVTVANDRCVFFGGKTGWTPILREGDPVPSLGGEVLAAVNTTSLTCNDSGDVAFVATLLVGGSVTTANDTGIWLRRNSGWTTIAREGDVVPGNANWTWTQINGGTNSPHLNEDGNVIVQLSYFDSVLALPFTALFGWTPEHGLRQLLAWGDTITTTLGTNSWTGISTAAGANSSDGGQVMFNNQGDFAIRPLYNNVSGPVLTAAIMKGHLGTMVCEPSAVPVGGGVPYEFYLDCGPTYGNQFYFILATGLGTRPGFPHPLNFGITVPMNYDPVWTAVSQAWVNSPLWTNTLGVTDANGVPLGNPPISFNMPPGYPGFQGMTVHHSALLFDGALMGTFATEPSAVKLY